jgi:hypothetical protein
MQNNTTAGYRMRAILFSPKQNNAHPPTDSDP